MNIFQQILAYMKKKIQLINWHVTIFNQLKKYSQIPFSPFHLCSHALTAEQASNIVQGKKCVNAGDGRSHFSNRHRGALPLIAVGDSAVIGRTNCPTAYACHDISTATRAPLMGKGWWEKRQLCAHCDTAPSRLSPLCAESIRNPFSHISFLLFFVYSGT